MKRYYYKKEEIKRSKMYGNIVYLLTVYHVENNELLWIGEVKQNSGSTCGDTGEVWKLLQKENFVPANVDVFNEMSEYMRENNILINEI